MSILFKGMEMPESCWECYFQDCGNCAVDNYKVVDRCILDGRRDDDCPLIEVPPHGRLIDADELQRQFERMANEEWNKNIAVSAASCFDDAAVIVEDATTIIEAED